MSQGFDLGQYLTDARSEGELNSEGSFTIAQEKALDKLAHFSLPGLYDWVLKIVQAANAWDCEILQIQQTRVATSFYFKPSEDRFPSDSDIVKALRQGSFEADGPVHELCIALRALVDQAQLSFVLATRINGELGEPIYSGDDVSALSEHDRTRWASLPIDGLRLTVSHFKGSESFTGRFIPTISGVARRNLEIAEILKKRALCSPTPILLDGREITNPLTNEFFGQNLYYRPVAVGTLHSDSRVTWRGYPALDDLNGYRRPGETRQREHCWCLVRTFGHIALGEYQDAMEAFQGTFLLDFYESVHHQVCYLRFGVICDRETVFNSSAATSCAFFIPADKFRSDLTGLSINKGPEVDKLVQHLLKSVIEHTDSLIEKLPNLSSPAAQNRGHAFEAEEKVVAVKELDAGFSIFTEGLLKRTPSGPTVIQTIGRSWRHLKGRPFRTELLNKWHLFLLDELNKMKKDLTRERRDAVTEL